MIEATIGIILATIASMSLLITLGISNKSIKNAGRQSLTISEQQIIRKAGYTEEEMMSVDLDIRKIEFK